MSNTAVELPRAPANVQNAPMLPTSFLPAKVGSGKWNAKVGSSKAGTAAAMKVPSMSWESAKKEARRWVDGLNLPTKSMHGQTIDLTTQSKSLKGEAKYLVMVIDAAKRLLKIRGVNARIDIEQDS